VSSRPLGLGSREVAVGRAGSRQPRAGFESDLETLRAIPIPAVRVGRRVFHRDLNPQLSTHCESPSGETKLPTLGMRPASHSESLQINGTERRRLEASCRGAADQRGRAGCESCHPGDRLEVRRSDPPTDPAGEGLTAWDVGRDRNPLETSRLCGTRARLGS